MCGQNGAVHTYMIVFFDKYVKLGDVVEFARLVGYVWQVLLGNCGLAGLASFVR